MSSNDNLGRMGRSTRASPNAFAVCHDYFARLPDPPLDLRDQGPPTAERLELFALPRGDHFESPFNEHPRTPTKLPATESSWASTARPHPPSAEGELEESSPGHATLVPAPSSNWGASGPSIRATVDALSSQSDVIIPYEKLYPGFDPKEDLEVNLSCRISICRWGSCQDAWCRLDKMWSSHIFADYKTPEDVTHKVEILSRESRLPNGKVKCLWEGCKRNVLVESLKKHVEDTHLLLYRLRCIHCATEYRHGSYRRIHGPASMCSKNPRFSQAANPPCPPQHMEQSVHAQADPNPPSPPSVPHSDPRDPSSSTLTVKPPITYQDSLGRYLDKRLEPQWYSLYAGGGASRAGAPIEPTWRTPASILSDLHRQEYKAQRRPTAPVFSPIPSINPDTLIARRSAVSPSAGWTTQAWDREPTLGPRAIGQSDMHGGRSGREAPHPAEVLGLQVLLSRAQPMNIPPRYAAAYLPQARTAKPAPSAPQFVNPELLVLRQPADNSTASQAVPKPSLKAKMGARRDVLTGGQIRRGGRRLIGVSPPVRPQAIQAVQRPVATLSGASIFRTLDDILEASGPAGSVGVDVLKDEDLGEVLHGLFDSRL